jgi:hypothetical protein
MDNNSEDFFDETHRSFWEQPNNHALVKASHGGVSFFSIFTLKPRLMYLMGDDIEDMQKLAQKMIDYGVKVFDTYEEFDGWYKTL